MRKDSERLAQLRRQLILGSTGEHAYDEITRLLATSLEVPITLINFMDEDHDWFKSAVGLSPRASPTDTSFCEAFFHTPDEIIVAHDTTLDARFKQHPFVIGAPFVRFYAAARITSAGHTLGTLCAYDMKPRQISVEQINTLRTLATAVMELLRKRTASGTVSHQLR
ncbi:MAG: GAF domain-containing protein [Rhizobacter sp.]|nr:GAF domain-containing protein [Burkholderiales bacterium]